MYRHFIYIEKGLKVYSWLFVLDFPGQRVSVEGIKMLKGFFSDADYINGYSMDIVDIFFLPVLKMFKLTRTSGHKVLCPNAIIPVPNLIYFCT